MQEVGRTVVGLLLYLERVQRWKNCTSGTVFRILAGGSWWVALAMSRSFRLLGCAAVYKYCRGVVSGGIDKTGLFVPYAVRHARSVDPELSQHQTSGRA